MLNLATLTMNPTIDISYEIDHLDEVHKIRADSMRSDPGGGGINVARVFVRLGGNARCFYLSGGATGAALDGLLDLHQLVRARIAIKGDTRVSTAILERGSGREFRISARGPEIAESEWQSCLDRLDALTCDYLVASGSLPPNVPVDFYSRVAAIAKRSGSRFVLDTSGPALAAGIADGGVFLAKPSLGEFRTLIGSDPVEEDDIAEAAMAVVRQGGVEYLAVTMGRDGALLASKAGCLRLPAIEVETRSSVGSGDSFLAAMVHALALGKEAGDAFRFGLAAGAAAVLTPGTDLCHPKDVQRLYAASMV